MSAEKSEAPGEDNENLMSYGMYIGEVTVGDSTTPLYLCLYLEDGETVINFLPHRPADPFDGPWARQIRIAPSEGRARVCVSGPFGEYRDECGLVDLRVLFSNEEEDEDAEEPGA